MAILSGIQIEDILPTSKVFHGLRVIQGSDSGIGGHLYVDVIQPEDSTVIVLPLEGDRAGYAQIMWSNETVAFSIDSNGHLRMVVL